MGLFGGDSKQKTNANTTTTTTTTTEFRDIGLTGNAAVDLVGAIAGGQTDLARINAQSSDYKSGLLAANFAQLNDSFGSFINEVGASYSQLVSGAHAIGDQSVADATSTRDAAAASSRYIIDAARDSAATVANGASALLSGARDAAERLLPNDAKDSAPLIYAALALAAVVAFFSLRRRA